MVRLLETVSAVRRRFQFFVWVQNHLQPLLPHEVAVCGAYQRRQRELEFEVFNSVVLGPEAMQLLSDPRSVVVRAAIAAWVRMLAQPVVITLAGIAAERGAASVQPLVDAGIVELLVHGVARPQRPAELESFFLLMRTGRRVPPWHSTNIEMLMPYLHSTYLRVCATEQEIGDAPQAAPRSCHASARLTDRESEVLAHVREGKSNQQIGEVMGISPLTVKNHVQKLLRKLGATNRAQAVAKTSGSRPVREGGFTLLELLVVMVIIGLLAGYVGPKVFANIGKSEVKVARAQIDALQKALEQYRVDAGHYPSTQQGLQALVVKPAGEARWGGPYLMKAVPRDPWHNDYQYRQPGEHAEYDLLSLGRDGRPGGEGENADLTSW